MVLDIKKYLESQFNLLANKLKELKKWENVEINDIFSHEKLDLKLVKLLYHKEQLDDKKLKEKEIIKKEISNYTRKIHEDILEINHLISVINNIVINIESHNKNIQLNELKKTILNLNDEINKILETMGNFEKLVETNDNKFHQEQLQKIKNDFSNIIKLIKSSENEIVKEINLLENLSFSQKESLNKFENYYLFGSKDVKKLLEKNHYLKQIVLKKLFEMIEEYNGLSGKDPTLIRATSTHSWRKLSKNIYEGKLDKGSRIFYTIEENILKIFNIFPAGSHNTTYMHISNLINNKKYVTPEAKEELNIVEN